MPIHKDGEHYWLDSFLNNEPKLREAVIQLIGELPILSVRTVNTEQSGIMTVTICYPLAGETHKALLKVATNESLQAAVARHEARTLSPHGIYEDYTNGTINRDEMLKKLAAIRYTPGEHPADEPEWGYIPGSWDGLVQLAIEGYITQAEFESIALQNEGQGNE